MAQTPLCSFRSALILISKKSTHRIKKTKVLKDLIWPFGIIISATMASTVGPPATAAAAARRSISTWTHAQAAGVSQQGWTKYTTDVSHGSDRLQNLRDQLAHCPNFASAKSTLLGQCGYVESAPGFAAGSIVRSSLTGEGWEGNDVVILARPGVDVFYDDGSLEAFFRNELGLLLGGRRTRRAASAATVALEATAASKSDKSANSGDNKDEEEDENKKRIRELEAELERFKKKAKTSETAKKAAATRSKNMLEKAERSKQAAVTKFQKTVDKAKTSINSIAQEYICPISHELMLDPVTAEDGQLYDRDEITKAIELQGANFRSPKTREKIGSKLLPAVSVKNTIEHLVESGIIDGELAKGYRQRKLVRDTMKKANDGDVEATRDIASWYRDGENGFPKDRAEYLVWFSKWSDSRLLRQWKVSAERGDAVSMNWLGTAYAYGKYGLTVDTKLAFEWYQKAADLRDPQGQAKIGAYTAIGVIGVVSRDRSRGIYLVTSAAERGSDSACFELGQWHKNGDMGFPVDKMEAIYWLAKVADGSCKHKYLSRSRVVQAKKWVEELSEEEDSSSEGEGSSSEGEDSSLEGEDSE